MKIKCYNYGNYHTTCIYMKYQHSIMHQKRSTRHVTFQRRRSVSHRNSIERLFEKYENNGNAGLMYLLHPIPHVDSEGADGWQYQWTSWTAE